MDNYTATTSVTQEEGLVKGSLSAAHDNLWQFIKYGIVTFIAAILIGYSAYYVPWWVSEILNYLIMGGFTLALLTFLVSIIPVGVKSNINLFGVFSDGENWKKILNLIIGNFIYAAIVFVGLILLIIPGIFFANRLLFWNFYVARDNQNFWEGMKSSWNITEGKVIEILIAQLKYFGLNIVGALALVIGLLWTMPASAIGMARVFDKIEKENS